MPNNIDDLLLNSALGFLQRHKGEYLHSQYRLLLSRATEALAHQHDLPQHRAQSTVLRAWAELESAQTPHTIDLSNSTSSMLVLHDRSTGARAVLTVATLAYLVKQLRHHARADLTTH